MNYFLSGLQAKTECAVFVFQGVSSLSTRGR